MINVAIIDDHQLILNGLELAFKSFDSKKYKAKGFFLSGEEFLSFLEKNKKHKIDVALIDFQMPGINGIDLIQLLRKKYPSIKTIIFSNHYETPLIKAAFKSGANSYLPKNCDVNEVFEAINEVYTSNYYLRDDFSAPILKVMISNKEIIPTYNFSADLSDREKLVGILITKEYSYKEIAMQLDISQRTVEDHKNSFKKKTGITKQAGIAAYCHWMGWV